MLSQQEEDDLITRCEDNIKRGQFNQTNSKLKPYIINYRQRGFKFHQDKVIVSINLVDFSAILVIVCHQE